MQRALARDALGMPHLLHGVRQLAASSRRQRTCLLAALVRTRRSVAEFRQQGLQRSERVSRVPELGHEFVDLHTSTQSAGILHSWNVPGG